MNTQPGSAYFLSGEKQAEETHTLSVLVDNEPGVTRDRREGDGALFGLSFKVVDTAGLGEAVDDSLEARMRRQTAVAVAAAPPAAWRASGQDRRVR